MFVLHLLTTLAIQLNGNPALAFFGDRVPVAGAARGRRGALRPRRPLLRPAGQPVPRPVRRARSASTRRATSAPTCAAARSPTSSRRAAPEHAPAVLRRDGHVARARHGARLGRRPLARPGRRPRHPAHERAHRRVPGLRAARSSTDTSSPCRCRTGPKETFGENSLAAVLVQAVLRRRATRGPRSLVPGILLGLAGSAAFIRLVRASQLERYSGDHVRTARSKGLPRAARDHCTTSCATRRCPW